MRILVVDDEYVSRMKLKALLSAKGDCDAVPNGDLALRMAISAYQEAVPYDLITMDIQLPDMTGQQVVHQLRQWEQAYPQQTEGREARILMITATSNPRDVMSSFREGAEWYLVKPVTPQALADALERVGLAQSPTARSRPAGRLAASAAWARSAVPAAPVGVCAAPAQASQAAPARPTPAPARESLVHLPDPSAVQADSVEAEFWSDYLASTHQKLDDLEAAAMDVEAGGDARQAGDAIMRLLHSLKGEAGMIGLMDLQKVCHDVESAFKQHGPTAQTADMILAVKDWMQAATDAVTAKLAPAQ